MGATALKQCCPSAVLELIDRFERNRDSYKRPTYNETQVRREFIDPLFKSLGWDIDNEQGHAEAYKDVIHEDAIKVGGATKAPDYCFRIGGTRKFFLEAKKPAVPLKDSPESAYQLRRYAWSAKLPLSILTDFEELAVYDCRIRPQTNDKPSTARTLFFRYDEYPERWGELAAVFSREAVLKGSFDKYAESARRKRGTAEVDVEFLKEIEEWRADLAKNFALRNPSLSVRDLNFAVQRTIDRIIFLRMCEDRGIEPYGQLAALKNGTAVYARLARLFRDADDKYNSGLFYFAQEPDRGPPDELTLSLELDDKVLKDIFARLYYPESPYEFSVLAPEILGQVYEQFLGRVITLTAGHRAKVEEKPEVRKVGGVYYTPTYIVDYIVKHTVGKLLEGKMPKDVGPDRETRTGKAKKLPKGAKMLRILDPACGSGSFLLGAYEYLLNWHRDWYVSQSVAVAQSVAPANSRCVQPNAAANQSPDRDGGAEQSRARLPFTSRSDVKGMEAAPSPANPQSPIRNPQSQWKDRIYQGPGGVWRLTIREKKRILLNNIYGVDIDPQAVEVTKLSLLLKVLEHESAETLGSTLRLFHERALPDLADNIKCGNSLIGPDFYDGKQLDMFDDETRYRINVFDWQHEFPDAFTPSPSKAEGRGEGETGFDAVIGNPPYVLLQTLGSPTVFSYLGSAYAAAKYKIDTYHLFAEKSLSLAAETGFVGLITPNTFLRNKHSRALRELLLDGSEVQRLLLFYYPVFARASVDTCILIAQRLRSPSLRHAVLVETRVGLGQLQGTSSIPQNRWKAHPQLEFDMPETESVTMLLDKLDSLGVPLGTFATAYFGIQTHDRQKYVAHLGKGPAWKPAVDGGNIGRYSLAKSSEWVDTSADAIKSGGNRSVYENERIGVRQIGKRPIATLLPAGLYSLNTIYNIYFVKPTNLDLRYLLALLSSQLLGWYWESRFFDQKRTFPKIKKKPLLSLPIREIDPENEVDRSRHDQLVKLVQQLLDLHKQLLAARTPQDKTPIQRQIDATNRQIDRFVYELYELTDDEIRIVETKNSP